MFFWVFLRRQIVLADVSEPCVSSIFGSFEDGTDTGFRNVGQLQFDAGEILKRTYTIFKSRQKFEIKKTLKEFYWVQKQNYPTRFQHFIYYEIPRNNTNTLQLSLDMNVAPKSNSDAKS